MPWDVPEMLTYEEHDADGRNLAHTSTGAVDGIGGLTEAGGRVGPAVPGLTVVPGAQAVIRTPGNRTENAHFQNRIRRIALP